VRSESVKGFVTRIGTRIVKGVCMLPAGLIVAELYLLRKKDIQLRLTSLQPPRGANSTRLNVSGIPGAPELVLDQLAAVRNLVNQGLDVIDVSTFTGDPLNASFISGQLHLLYEHISEAKSAVKGKDTSKWWEKSADSSVCELIASKTS
jgi:Rogdi leucine zipper containing protein